MAFGQESAGTPLPAAGQTGGNADITEIIVTAERREQRLSDVGMSLAVVSGDELEHRGVLSVGDLGVLVPGMTTGETGFSAPIYTLRGVGINEPTATAASSVAIYVDEVPLAYPVTTLGTTLDMQRVEVLKGPQGTLYGQNSTGGAINFIARKPTDRFEAGITTDIARFGKVQAEGYASGPIGGTLKARVALRTVQGGAWQKSMSRNDELGDNRRVVGRAMLLWEPRDDLSVHFNFHGFTNDSDTLAPQLIKHLRPGITPEVTEQPTAPAEPRITEWDPDTDYRSDDRFYQGSVRVSWDVWDSLSVTSVTAFSRHHADSLTEWDGTSLQVSNYGIYGSIRSLSHETRLSGDVGPLSWMIGANFSDDTVRDVLTQYIELHGSSLVLGNKYDVIVYGGEQEIRSWAVFSSLRLGLTDRFSLSAGVRYSEDEREASNCTRDAGDGRASFAFTNLINTQRAGLGLDPIEPIPPGGCVTIDPSFLPVEYRATLKEDNVPWNVSLNWNVRPSTLVYGRVSRGYKAGLFPTIAAVNTGTLSPVRQEKLTAYEIGTRMQPAPRVRVEAAVFHYDYANKQVRGRKVDPVFGNVQSLVSIPESRITGAELAAAFGPFGGLSFSASAVYLDSEVERYVGYNVANEEVDFAGAPLNFTPKRSLNADLNYTRRVSSGLNAFGGINVAYRSRTSAAMAAPPDFDIAEYTLVDAQLGIESVDGVWKAWVWGKNLTDEYYWTNMAASSGLYRFVGMPLTYGLSFSRKF